MILVLIRCWTHSQRRQLRRAPRLLRQPLYLRAVGRHLLLQPQVALQQRRRARLVLPMILAGQQWFPVAQPGVGLRHICKVLNRQRAVSLSRSALINIRENPTNTLLFVLINSLASVLR